MVIYSNNLHEKLQGVAISREYLKYNTPFCDIVDDPDFQLDIDLAIDYNNAVNGNLAVAERFVQNLVINVPKLDWSTIEYYTHKIVHNPIFDSIVRNIKSRFDNPELYSDGYQESLNKQLKDCLNSPCNLFLDTSDSIGRMAQATSTKSAANTFGVGDLKDTFTNMIGELDQAVFNKIPALFQDGIIEVTQLANKAWTNTQAVLAGKKNLSELSKLAQSGQSFRNTDKVYRYTPDIKSYFDFNTTGSAILNKIKENLGGCFDKYQYKYRYNPYIDNTSFPSGTHPVYVNGETIEADGANKIQRVTDNNVNLKAQTGNFSSLPPYDNTPVSGKGYSDGKVAISKTFTLQSKKSGVTSHYSVFAGLVDYGKKRIWYEDYAALAGDIMTLKGIGNLGEHTYKIGASYITSGGLTELEKAIKGQLSDSDKHSIGINNVTGQIAAGWKHNLTDEGMEKLYNTPKSGIINDGVAISQTLFNRFINDPTVTPLSKNYKTPLQLSNEFFAAIRVPNGKWYYYKVIDRNGQKESNVDMTVGAYQHFMSANNLGELGGANKGVPIGNTGWVRIKKVAHDDLGTIEVKICQGSIDNIKEQMGDMPAELVETNPNVSYVLSGKIRSRPIQPELANMINAASAKSGYKIVVTSGGQIAKADGGKENVTRTGSKRHDDGWAADIEIYDGSTRLSAENPNHFDRLYEFAKILKSVGIQSIGAGPGYMNGNVHIDIAITNGRSGAVATRWGNGGLSANTPRWLRSV
jgi:hypothetical protein